MPKKIKFACVAEGATDLAVLEAILSGYFGDADGDFIKVEPLSPLLDASNKQQKGGGGWTKVFHYCQSQPFQTAFQAHDFIVIQIDTDCAHEWHFNERKLRLDFTPTKEMTVLEVMEIARTKFETLFKAAFGNEFLAENQAKIIYAISVNSIECWLLPANVKLLKLKTDKSKIKNCFEALQLNKEKDKNYTKYGELAAAFLNQDKLHKFAKENESLAGFIDELNNKLATKLTEYNTTT